MDEREVPPSATPVAGPAGTAPDVTLRLNSSREPHAPSATKKLTLTDMWKKTKKKQVDVVVLNQGEADEVAGQEITENKADNGVLDVPDVEGGLMADPADIRTTIQRESTPLPVAATVHAAKNKVAPTKDKVAPAKRGRSKRTSTKRVDLVAVGSLHVRDGWFNSGYIFPAGFKSRTQFRSSVELSEQCVHECEVIGEGGRFWPKPTFRVVAMDLPEAPLDGKSCTACWTAVQKRINGEIERRRAAGEDLPPAPKTAIAGTEYFGFNHENIVAAIEALDGERKAVAYWEGKAAVVEQEAVEVEMKMCEDVYGDQHNASVKTKSHGAKPALSSDGSVVTEDAEDVFPEEEQRVGGDAVDQEMKEVVLEMANAVVTAVEAQGDVECKVDGNMGGEGGVAMEVTETVEVVESGEAPAVSVPQRSVAEDLVEKPTKKRRSFSFDPSTVADMEALYAKSSLPSKADKVILAEKHGIEVKQIESWMGKRRKADKDAASGIVKVKKMPAKKADVAVDTGANTGTNMEPGVVAGQIGQAAIKASALKPQKPTKVPLSDEVLRDNVGMAREQLEAEETALKERGLLAPLVDLASLVGSEPTEYSDNRLCYLAVGQRLTLTELVEVVSPMFDAATRPTVDAMCASVALMLERKSADPVNRSVKALDRVDWKNSDDQLGEGMWQWEVKNKEHLDRQSGARAMVIKRRAAKVLERLKAIANVLSLSDSDTQEKVGKVVAAFEKSSSLIVLEAEAEGERKKEKLKEDTERLRVEKKQEKERLKAEKEAEKLRLKEEKEVEKEQKKVEKEQKKLAEKTGFKDSKTLEKSASMFTKFFGAKPAAKSTDHATEDTGEKAKADKQKAGTYYERRFLKPTLSSSRISPVPVALNLKIASECHRTHQELVAELRSSMKAARAKYAAEQADLKKRCLGLPPSWARKADAVEVAEQNMHQLTSNGLTPENIQTYRRKFIYPKDAYTVRPPFYGSKKPLETNAVGPRRFLGKDPSLDYEVMSDEDWEEEPEGSSLSQDDAMSEDDAGEGDEDENSFCVGDGYLSADEGIRSDDDGVIAMDETDLCFVAKGSKGGRPELSGYLEKSRRSGKPFVLVRDSAMADANHGACYRGDTALCASLELEILLPGARFEVPDLDEETLLRLQTKEKPTKRDEEKIKEKPTFDDLLPDLTAYILANAAATKPSLIDGFVERHKDRKLTKKWVGDSITTLASRSGKVWKLKPATDTHGLPDGGITPLCTLRAPMTDRPPVL